MIRPLTGQALIEMLPDRLHYEGRLEIPDQQERPIYGVVRQIGHWPADKKGFHHLPDFSVGDVVVVGRFTGTKLDKSLGNNFKIVRQRDVLAKVTA